ncbi:MAG: endonuclease III [Alphaproteobacteria bacterium]|nr:endonuclease III [Alphaproteobacteria bacterium]
MQKLMDSKQLESFCAALLKAYPSPKCELKWTNTWELIVAIILSAQSTDKNVNTHAPALFAAANTPEAMLKMGYDKVHSYLTSINYHNNKAKSIMALAQVIVDKFGGQMPKDYDTLLTLPGIGHKTASVFLNVAYHAPRIGVDTHVFRLCHRLGIAFAKTPEELQKKLEQIVPEKYKPDFALALVLLGRYICTARKVKCDECPMYTICISGEKKAC